MFILERASRKPALLRQALIVVDEVFGGLEL
jgi:hypothetical protein